MAELTVYPEYGFQGQYGAAGVKRTRGVFGVVAGLVECLPAILLGQRDSKGTEAYRDLWELPGGVWKNRDPREVLQRHLKREIGILRSRIGLAIGLPLYRPTYEEEKSDGRLISVDAAQAYLVVVTRGRIKPNPDRMAVQVAFANANSLRGFTLLGNDRDRRELRRMSILVYDGLSILDEPFYVGPLTNALRDLIVDNPEASSSMRFDSPGNSDIMLVAGGSYLGLPFFVANEDELVPGAKLGWNIKLFKRRNPYQPGGCFSGPLDYLDIRT
jgi:hypothetical protein